MPIGDLTNLAVPETLTAVIASRLDALDPADRAIISDAAVLGQSFTVAGLSAVSGVTEEALVPRLRNLVRGELLTLETDPRSPERGQYAFVQALIREVAYNTLAKRDRKIRHLAAARFFESLESDELAGGLAGHYLAAYQNAGDGTEAEDLKAQARIALGGAAERAVVLGSHTHAIRFLKEALSLTDDPTEQAALLERAGASAAAAAHHDAAERYLTRALAIHRAGTDRVAMVRTTTALADALLSARQSDRVLAILVAATVEFADLAPDQELVGLQAQLARAYFLREDNPRAIETIEPVLEASEHADLVPVLADALVTKGSALNSGGRLREGLAILEGAERLARSAGLTSTVLRALNNRLAQQWLIDPQTCVAGAQDGLALARTIGSRSWTYTFLEKVAHALWLTGDWDAALGVAASGLEDDPEPADALALVAYTSMIMAARGEPVAETLEDLARTALPVSDPQVLWMAVEPPAFSALADGRLAELGEMWRAVAAQYHLRAHQSLYLAGATALRRGDSATATGDLARLDAVGTRAPLIEAHRSLLRAGLAALRGDDVNASRQFEAGVRELRRLGLPFEQALAVILMSTVLEPGSPAICAASEEAFERLYASRGAALPRAARDGDSTATTYRGPNWRWCPGEDVGLAGDFIVPAVVITTPRDLGRGLRCAGSLCAPSHSESLLRGARRPRPSPPRLSRSLHHRSRRSRRGRRTRVR